MTSQDSTPPAQPLLRVVSGDPSAEELAALMVVVAAAAGATDGESGSGSAGSQWAAPARLHRGAVHAGPIGSWWASGLPKN